MATKCPKDVQDRIRLSRQVVDDRLPAWKEAMEFARGNHYAYVSDGNKLLQQATQQAANGTGKPKWRVRQSRNLIFPILDAKISAATQRVPGYEVLPSTTDNEDVTGAYLAQKIALAGYGMWNVRRATEAACWWAFTPGEGFAMAYWDKTIGPYFKDDEGNTVGQGDVRIRVYGAPEVSWEPGCAFEDSSFYVIQHARPTREILTEPGYIGPKDLPSNAEVDFRTKPQSPSKLTMVTEYMERPSRKNPEGRWLTIAAGTLILPEAGYPKRDRNNVALDEPALRRISYMIDPASDRDQGIVPQLIDPARTFNDALNKVAEWKNVALVPQILAPVNSIQTRPTDEPGSIIYYNPVLGMKPEFRNVPPIPRELFELADRMQALTGFIASQNQVPSQVESGKGIQALLEQDQTAWGNFMVKLADFHAGLMRDCLTLVQRHYTEPRLIQFRGRTGWESIKDFQGVDLHGQTDVRVSPGSLEPRTRASIEQKVMNFAQMGWIGPEQAMAAINDGSAEKLIESYELDYARANLVVSKIRSGEFLNESSRPVFPGEDATDPETDEPLDEVPGWMPRAGVDNLGVHKAVFADWFKTDDWDRLEDAYKEASLLYYRAVLDLEAKEAQRQQEMQDAQAQQMGMNNASKPSQATPQSSLPAIPA